MKATGGTLFKRHISALEPPWRYIISPPFTKFPNPPNKDVGEGLNTAFAAMKMMSLRDPEIKQGEHSVTVYIRHTRLSSPEDAVMEYLRTQPEITNTVGRVLTGIRSENTMKNVFIRLRDRDLIEAVPGKLGRSSAWRLKISPTQGKFRI